MKTIFTQCPSKLGSLFRRMDSNKNIDKIISLSTSNTSNSLFITEGKAKIINEDQKKVFYNPVQEFNRDLSIAVLSVFAEDYAFSKNTKKRPLDSDSKEEVEKVSDLPVGSVFEPEEGGRSPKCVANKTSLTGNQYIFLLPYEVVPGGITILEALSATGLRSIRFALEIPGVKEIIANDLSLPAVQSIKANISANNVENLVKTNQGDASLLMYTSKYKFDAIDLDPYGSPSRFLDSAVQSVKDGGLLLVTCTDMAVLAGNSPETCYTKYGAISLRFPPCHEMALRIALKCIESHANRHGRYIEPVLSVSVDFYIRLIVRVFTSQARCKETTCKLSHVYVCVGCKSYLLHPMGTMGKRPGKAPLYALPHVPNYHKCQHCGHEMKMGGPIWNAPMHDRNFIIKVLKHLQENPEKYNTERRIEGMLTLLVSELDCPLYITPDNLCGTVHAVTIPLQTFRSALLNGGYQVSEAHAAKNSVKTNAPFTFIWDIIRDWVKHHPVSQNRLEKEEVVKNILSKVPSEINFTFHPSAVTKAGEILRYQVNPQPHWGPGYKATQNVLEVVEKKRKEKLEKKKSVNKGNDTNKGDDQTDSNVT